MDLSKRVFGLDLMRTVAILLVLYSHVVIYILRDLYHYKFENWLFIDGVDLFFVLSGFLIGGILISFYESERNVSFKTTLRHFWQRRWFRTLPLYYAILALYLVIDLYHSKNISSYLSSVLFLQNLYHPISTSFGVSWSLVVEEWFYLLAPIVFILISGIPMKMSVKNRFLIMVGVFAFIPFLFRLFHAGELGSLSRTDWSLMVRMVAIYRFDTLAFGMLGAHFAHYYKYSWRKYKLFCLFIGISLLIFIRYGIGLPYDGIFYRIFYFDFLSIGILLLLPVLSSIRMKKPNPFVYVITYISIISYALYLLHMFAVNVISYYGTDLFPKPYLAILFFIIFTFAISSIIYHFFEKPMTDLRDRL